MSTAGPWHKEEVRQVGEVITGTTPSTKNPNYYGGEYKLISPADLDNGKYVTTAHRRLSALGLEQCRVLPKDTVLVGCIGNVGKIGMVADEKAATNQQINAVICCPDYDPHFVYYSLLHNQQRLANVAVKTTVPILNKSSFQRFQLDVPLFPEQHRIAHVLSTVQVAIEQQARLIALTRELKSALMHKLFAEGLHGEEQKEIEIGPVPDSWTVEQLSSLCTIKHGFGFKGEYFKLEGTHILLTPGHFFEEGGFRDQREKTKFCAGKLPHDFILQEGDLLIAMTEQKSGLLGSSIIIPVSGRYLHNQRLGLVQNLDSRLDKEFLYYYFNTSYCRMELSATATGSKVRHTSPAKVLNLVIAFPTIEEQRGIAFALRTVDRKLVTLVEKSRLLQELFRTLLHRLMTGQIRVSERALQGFT